MRPARAWARCAATPTSRRQSAKAIEELTQKQAAILASAARLVKPGGRLVYATCSVLPQENEAIADAFAAEHSDFVAMDAGELLAQLKVERGDVLCSGGETGTQYLRLWPQRHETDGFSPPFGPGSRNLQTQ